MPYPCAVEKPCEYHGEDGQHAVCDRCRTRYHPRNYGHSLVGYECSCGGRIGADAE